jgi:hypothetical protein
MQPAVTTFSRCRIGNADTPVRRPPVVYSGVPAWTWRHNLTFYDALYVAVFLDLPLLTADVRLSGAPGLPCTIGLV